ncbi:MAG: hypothetical protein JEZ11_12015 [Desulfobacterales bacterium]|nr:hypothetical protein [Desulfobacterales bacterium]
MRIVNKFWWIVFFFIFLTLCVLLIMALLLWGQLGSDQQQLLTHLFKTHFGYVFGGICVILAAIGFAIDGIYRNYVLPINRLTEETRLIHAVNPSHRIRVEGGRDMLALAQVINEGADQFEALFQSVGRKIEAARSELEDEKNILVAIMAELPEGVLICNTDGRILLYNRRARHLLSEASEEDPFIGLDRNVFRVISKGLLDLALSDIAFRLNRNEPNIAATFVMMGQNGKMLQVETVPILEEDRRMSGFVLIIHDISRQLECDGRRVGMIESLTTGMRAALANLRAAIETLTAYPEMPPDRHRQFTRIIHHEALTLTRILEKEVAHGLPTQSPAGWPMATMAAGDLTTALQRSVAALDPPIVLTVGESSDGLWIRVDSVSMVFALHFLLERIRSETGADRFATALSVAGNVVRIDLDWKGRGIDGESWRRWKALRLDSPDKPMPMTLGEVLDQHGIEIWHPAENPQSLQPRMRIFIPAVEAAETETGRQVTLLPRSRPEFYDFDLFNQPGQTPELENRRLTELTFTVFDTETTGLNPRGGDEIIAVGAVRIVNCQLLQGEIFDQLVDPKRGLPWESIKIHGIQPEMLQGKPTIDSVLPRFHKFVANTILVGHNAAFDLRMLQVKEAPSGVRFVNPVLDTMLLSAVVHPAQDDHSVEALAQRLGVRVQGRHSALGDALTTGELFLRLIPLLAKMNIHTLREARIASQKTYYARLKY